MLQAERSVAKSARRPPAAKEHFVLTLWTDDPALARAADTAGVDRIGLDLEVHGKAERQPKNLKTWISPHSEDKLPALRAAMKSSKLFCRVNPINPKSADEIERLITRFGVQVLMLPMFTTPGEVERFVELVDGRATTVLLMENKTAAERIEEIVRVPGVDDVHVGINDLTLSLGRENANRFEVMATDLMARVGDAVLAAGLRFGVGGIGRAKNNDQVIPGDLIYAQYPRLGATAALIARSFFTAKPGDAPVDVTAEIRRARERLAWWGTQSPADLEAARLELLARARGATW
jgi:2-keto-3-deoxy-L-rhamnonate aldolase RhmA